MPFRLRPDVVTTDTDDGVVLLDERSGRYWQLNPTGADVLRALLDGEHPDHVAREITTRYRTDFEQVQHDVAELIERLSAAKLVHP